MKGQKGRPKQAVTQERQIGFFLTNAQFAIVCRKMEAAHVNISDYMRQVALHSEVKAKWTAEERGMVRTLVGMSVDLHELAMAARDQGAGVAAELFELYRDVMDEIIKKLCDAR
jgi:class 3 adenylate cyclase